MLRATISGLQRDTSIRQRGSDLNNRSAIAWSHASQRSHRSVDDSQIRYLCYTLELLGAHLAEWRKHRHHRVVNPDIDWAELTLDCRRGGFNPVVIREIDLDDQRAAAERFHFLARGGKAGLTSGEQADSSPAFREFTSRCATYTGGRTRDNDSFHTENGCNSSARDELLAELLSDHELQAGPHIRHRADLDVDEAKRHGDFPDRVFRNVRGNFR